MTVWRKLVGQVLSILKSSRTSPGHVSAVEETGPDNSVADYWTDHNVTSHRRFGDAAESLAYFRWRNDQYFDYIKLMPVDGCDGLTVLDYGCGPGNDLVGFATQSRPRRLLGMDVSRTSICEARSRLKLHGMEAEFHLLQEGDSKIPLEDGAVDFIHCSGVLHHMERPEQTLREFRRVLSPHGRIQVMVYNRDSLWFHLYCAYHLQVVQGRYSGASLEEVFRSSTDGDNCPVSRAYKPAEFINLARDAGLDLYLRGIALSAHEMSLFHTRFAAIMDPSLPNESREFLINLGVDQRGLATAGSRLAGIDACFAGSVAGF